MDNIRILLADDHPVVRVGLQAMLSQLEEISVVSAVSSGEEALEELDRLEQQGEKIDVVLMDLHMGSGMSGVSATQAIRGKDRPPAVLIVTTYDTDAEIFAALEAGASGYMLKDASGEEIRRAINATARGRVSLDPQVANVLVHKVSHPAPVLTPREVQILQLLALGLSNRAIARKLFLAESTVKTHLVHVYEKLGVESRTAALSEATRRGVVRF